jgi:hypothetical protein
MQFILFIAIILSLPQLSGVLAAYADQPLESYVMYPVTLQTTERFNDDNWFTLSHPQIAEFSLNPDGSWYGLTVNGTAFRQFPVPNDAGIRVMRFEMDDHAHYIVEGEVAYTLAELSVALARAYTNHVS